MGWNSWNTFECKINETPIKAVADAFVRSGMRAAGYQYVNLDDCWMDGRDSSGNLEYDLCKGDRNSFAKMRDALGATGRSIVYSINPGNGGNDVCSPNTCSLNLASIANMWRIGFDINASWATITSLIDQDAPLYSYAGPGH